MSLPAHWIRQNETTRLPRCFVYLDTEAHQQRVKGGEVQTFHLAATRATQTRAGRPDYLRDESATFTDTPALWEWIDKRCSSSHRTVLVAHNLAYDLRISNALFHLPARGWTMKACRLDGGQAWVQWANGTRSLTMVDSLSWLPLPLDELAKKVGMVKPALPRWNAPAEQWVERCQADVAILSEVWSRVMEWLRTDDLGNFKPTGAGQAWAAFRHRFLTHNLLVHNDTDARDAERRAAWTGRCEAWRHGEQQGGPWWEWDLTTAYAVIARDCEVPIRLAFERSHATPKQWAALTKRYAVVADVTVTTDVPTVPARSPHGIYWPVGTFETTLWDHEVALAERCGATVKVGRCWAYRKAPALRAWAEWVLGELAREDGDLDPVVRVVLKHWSRALIGRFGSKWGSWVPFGEHEHDDVSLQGVTDLDTGETFKLLQLGRQTWRSTPPVEGPDACPQVMSWIMAEARCRLWTCMEIAGFDHVLYVDTDGLIVDRHGDTALRGFGVDGLRRKHRYGSLDIKGPRQLVVGARLRAAGVSKNARAVGGGRYEVETWRSLATSLHAHEADRVVIGERTVRLRGTDHRRHHLPDGTTAPVWTEPDRVSVYATPPSVPADAGR